MANEITQVFFNPDGKNSNPGTVALPKLDLDGFKYPTGDLTFFIEAGHAVGAIVVPPLVTRFELWACKRKMNWVFAKGNDPRQAWDADLPSLHDAWPQKEWATFGSLHANCDVVLRHFLSPGDIDITAKGVAGATEEEDTHRHVVFQNGLIQGQANLGGSETFYFVPQYFKAVKGFSFKDCKGRGRIHMQGTDGDIEVDGNEIPIILGHTDINEKSPTYGKPLDSCKYNRITGKMAKCGEEAFQPYGTGKRNGLISNVPDKPYGKSGVAKEA